jgi:hypothetical protein
MREKCGLTCQRGAVSLEQAPSNLLDGLIRFVLPDDFT